MKIYWFKTPNCYEYWKSGFLCHLKNLMENFSHIQIDETNVNNDEAINKAIERLSSIPSYYEKLVVIMFK